MTHASVTAKAMPFLVCPRGTVPVVTVLQYMYAYMHACALYANYATPASIVCCAYMRALQVPSSRNYPLGYALRLPKMQRARFERASN